MSLVQVRQSGQLYVVSFAHPDRDEFMRLVDGVKTIGATYDKLRRAWVLAESRKADVLAHCAAFAKTPADFQAACQKALLELTGAPPLDGPLQPDIPGQSLMPHQEEGVKFIAEREGSLLAWEVGVGKTAAVIAAINAAGDGGFPSLIVCPAHLKRNWYSEFKGDPELGRKGWLVQRHRTVGIASGNYFPPTDVVIINYEILHRHKETIDRKTWAFVASDEIHYAKNPKAQRTRALIGGTKGRGKNKIVWKPTHGKRRIGLTATPLVNKPEDIWAMCNWLDPKRWPSHYWFVDQFCTTKTRDQWTKTKAGKPVCRRVRDVLPPSDEQMDRLNRRLTGTIMSRIRSKDVLDLPPIVRRVIEVDVPNASPIRAESKAVESTRDRATTLRAAVEVAKATGDQEEYNRAVRALRDFVNSEKEHLSVLRKNVALAKVPFVMDHLRDLLLGTDHKVILFAHHRAVIREYVRRAEEIVPGGVVHFYGESTPGEKETAEKRIQSDPDCRLIVAGITAAGTGLTLTGASVVVFAEEDWVPANIKQCEGRAWRKGQEKTVQVDHVVAHGSVESLIAKRVIAKQEIADRVVDGDLTLDEPVDWLADHNLPTDEDLAHDVPDSGKSAYFYGLSRIVREPEAYGVSDLDLVVASRLNGRSLEGKAAAYARILCVRYLGASEDDPVRLPDREWK